MFVANTEGEILNVNKHLLLSFDYQEKSNIIGRNMMCLFSEISSDKVLNDIVKLYEHGLISHRRHSFISFDRHKFLASIRMVLLTDEFNKTIGILGIVKNDAQGTENNEHTHTDDRELIYYQKYDLRQ